MNRVTVKHLHISLGDKHIVNDVSLEIESGKIHVLMGPNGSGKSTVLYGLMGKWPKQTTGSFMLDGREMIHTATEERAKAGLLLVSQNHVAIPGVSVIELLREAQRAQGKQTTMSELMKMVKAFASEYEIKPELLERSIFDGFSGGEKKKIALLEALVLQPAYALIDEIDTGLDVDALKLVGKGICALQKNGTGILLVTHSQKILSYIHYDTVSVMKNGNIEQTGGKELVSQIESQGYKEKIE